MPSAAFCDILSLSRRCGNNTGSLRKSRVISRHGKQTASGSLRMISSGFPCFHCLHRYAHIFGEQVLCHPRFQTDGPYFFRLKRLYRFNRQRDRGGFGFQISFFVVNRLTQSGFDVIKKAHTIPPYLSFSLNCSSRDGTSAILQTFRSCWFFCSFFPPTLYPI